jgi:hypothetical protein
MRVSLVPIDAASFHDDHVQVPYDKATINDAPNIEPDRELSAAEEERLYMHYGVDYGGEGEGMTGTEPGDMTGTREGTTSSARLRRHVTDAPQSVRRDEDVRQERVDEEGDIRGDR